MRALAVIALIVLAGSNAFAEPEIKGTATELAQYIGTVPKTVRVSGESEVRVPARRAVLTLHVVSENKSLQEALRLNAELRTKVAEYLTKRGIPAERIQSSKFSSTPKYGIFTDKVKSYRIENAMRVTLQEEKEFSISAGVVDMSPDVQYGEVEFEYADRDSLKAKAISQACDSANERKKIYEEKLGLKLVPASFEEGRVAEKGEAPMGGYASKSLGGLSSSPAYAERNLEADSISSFGELVYTARVVVEYTVQK